MRKIRTAAYPLSIGCLWIVLIAFLLLHACKSEKNPDLGSTDLPDDFLVNPYNPPRYFSVYEHHITQVDDATNVLLEADLLRYAEWIQEEWVDHGVSMIVMDGWGDVRRFNQYGYRTHHSQQWEHDYAYWAKQIQQMGLDFGMYDNPLWVHKEAADQGARIIGTNIPLSNLIDVDEETLWFNWVQVDREGAEEYVKGYVEHYASMGIRYLRVDFLSWFEDGYDKNQGVTGPKRTKEEYIKAMKWIREACDEHGMFFSAVMPSLNEEALIERHFAHMIRINEDVGDGGWYRFSEMQRGIRRPFWSQFANTFDGFIYWSQYAEKGQVILDGDFIRLNTMANDAEKRSVITLHTFAGGAISIADRPSSIGNNKRFYTNSYLNALSLEGFRARPLSHDVASYESQIWVGTSVDGHSYIAFFNREQQERKITVNFADFTNHSVIEVIDLWQNQRFTMPSDSTLEMILPAHDVKAFNLKKWE